MIYNIFVACFLLVLGANAAALPPAPIDEPSSLVTEPQTVTEPKAKPATADLNVLAEAAAEPTIVRTQCEYEHIENEVLGDGFEPVEDHLCNGHPVDLDTLGPVVIREGDLLDVEIVDGRAIVLGVVKSKSSAASSAASKIKGLPVGDDLRMMSMESTAATKKMLGSILVVRIPLDGQEPFHSTAQIRTALYGSTDEEEVPKFRRSSPGNTLEVFCESALMSDEKCVGMMSKVTIRDFNPATDGTNAHFKRPMGVVDGYNVENLPTKYKLSFWFKRLLQETGEWDQYDRRIAIVPSGAGQNAAYFWRGSTIMGRTQDTWTTYAHELGHAMGVPHSSAPAHGFSMYAYGDEAMMGSRSGKTDFNAPARVMMGWISGEDAAVQTATGTILKPLNVAETEFAPGLILKQACTECWSKPIGSFNNQDKPGEKGGTLVASFRVGRDAGGDNNDFGIVSAGLVNKVHVHFLSETIQRWAVLAEGESFEWRANEDGDGSVLGGLVVCKLVVTAELTEDYAAVAVGSDAADARRKCAPWSDAFPETLSIAGHPAYATSHRTRGEYHKVAALTHAGAPVYRGGRKDQWSLYRRNNGKWYLDFNGVDDSWSGTVNYAYGATETPFTARWNKDMVVAHSTVSVVGKPAYERVTEGVYNLDLGLTYASAPVYRRAERGYGVSVWSLYKRENGKWVVDFNGVDERWTGTINYGLNMATQLFDSKFNRNRGGGTLKVLRGSWGDLEVGSGRRLQLAEAKAAELENKEVEEGTDEASSQEEEEQDDEDELAEVPEPSA